MIQQYNEITTQTQNNDCNVQLNHNSDMIPITGLCKLTITVLGVLSPWEGIRESKPAQIYCSLQTSFCWFFSVFMRATYALSHAGLAD